MAALTMQAVLALSLQCAPAVDPHMIVAIGQRESQLDPLTIHDNTTGRVLHGDGVMQAAATLIAAGHSVDLGLMQINSSNLDLLGLPLRDAFSACKSAEAAAKLLALWSRYNTGSPTRGLSNGYAFRVMDALDAARGEHLPNAATGSDDEARRHKLRVCYRSADVWADDPCAQDKQDFVHDYGATPQ
jgi:type IV secretion system protein VirB1